MISKISLSNILSRPLSTALSVVLLVFGLVTVLLVMSGANQLQKNMANGSQGIDLVVGAKGSPMQLILCNIFHIDFPTGNIPIREAYELSQNRMIRTAIPLSLGDAYMGKRIVGTNSQFLDHYQVELADGSADLQPWSAFLGSNVALEANLKLGDSFTSTHGMPDEGTVHDEHLLVVTGIAKSTGTPFDDLIVTDLRTVWEAHGKEELGIDSTVQAFGVEINSADYETGEITSMLINYANPMAAIRLPRLVNSQTSLQAASPAFELARLFSLLENAINALTLFGTLVIILAGFSVFLSLLNTLKERVHELAVMRSMGATRIQLIMISVVEGLLIVTISCGLALLITHFALRWVGTTYNFPGLVGIQLGKDEVYVLLASFALGVVASVLPVFWVMRTSVSSILSKR